MFNWTMLPLGTRITFPYIGKTGKVRKYTGKLVEVGNTGETKSQRTGKTNEDYLSMEMKWAGGTWVTRTFDKGAMLSLPIER